ncbi:sodium:solute symporter family transporter [Flagellimonas taeanensis]|uniref:sodium:solute symporter family transporter n=2 Tax=Flavobacteriales TaxID=200644 RepID=UPI001C718A58|nr:sodium/solute symporter [Allomuricauda taeanensis]
MRDSGKKAKAYVLFYVLVFLLGYASKAQDQPQKKDVVRFDWQTSTQMPQGQGFPKKGMAGGFSGVHNDALLLAGGANFPNGYPWEMGQKHWEDQIIAITKEGVNYNWHSSKRAKLPVSMGYGVSLPTKEGLLCLGGNNAKGIVIKTVLISWDPLDKDISQQQLGNLPEKFEVAYGAVHQEQVYLGGIANGANKLFQLPLSELLGSSSEQKLSWKELPPCPGPPRKMPSYAVQGNGQSDALYIFSGRSETEAGIVLLDDGYSFDFPSKEWNRIINVPPVMAAPALSFGVSNILVFGGDGGDRLQERDVLSKQIQTMEDVVGKDSLQSVLNGMLKNHTGFSDQIWSFNTITNSFQKAGRLPENPPVTTNTFFWGEKITLPMGEISPGVRSTGILQATVEHSKGTFGYLNYMVLGLYFIVLLGIGIYFSTKQKTTDDYFKGGGRVPWWAAGLSVFGTALSAITFMAIPAKTYATDWSYFFYNLSVLLSTAVVVWLFIPLYRKLQLTTAYEYLEQRFNLTVRMFGSISFMLFQIGRIAIVLYLPAIALSLVTGIDISLCIVVVGAFSIAYTLIGGIEAVIWTDVVQVIVLMGGAILSLVVIFFDLGDDVQPMLSDAMENNKLTLTHFDFSWNEPTIWVVIVGGFFANLITYSSDQTLVQRYLTTKDESGARKTAWTNALLVIPSTLIFFSVGTALFLYYTKFPDALDPMAENNDAIFPWFIINELPAGVSGLLIAGLFSAAMSSLSSSINSTGTVFTIDIYKRFYKGVAEKKYLKVARYATLLSGVLGVLFALWMASFDIESLWDEFFKVLGLFTGGLGGLFLLGVCFPKANSQGAVIGLLVSSVVQFFVSTQTNLHIFLYSAIGLGTCVLVGYLSSFLFPKTRK